MTRLSNKPYAFRSFGGKLPSEEEVREELENLYEFLVDDIEQALEKMHTELDVRDEVLAANGQVVFANNDVVMVTGIPNS